MLGKNSRKYHRTDEAIAYVEELVQSNPNITTVYLPWFVYEGLVRGASSPLPPKPEPPKYVSSTKSKWGFFTDESEVSYSYNFNDPEYLERLKTWMYLQDKLAESSYLTLQTSVRQVTVKPNHNLKYKEISDE